MRNVTIRQTVTARDEEENTNVKRFFKRRKYIDPMTGLVFDTEDTLAENKAVYLKTFGAVCQGKFKNMFDAHKAFVG